MHLNHSRALSQITLKVYLTFNNLLGHSYNRIDYTQLAYVSMKTECNGPGVRLR